MEASRNIVMVPSPGLETWVPVDWEKVQRRLQKTQRQIDRARRRAEILEKILYKSFTSAIWLWYQQGGICPWCGKPITPCTGWSRHHIIPRSQGGSDALVNLQLLHPECHPQLHQDWILEQDCSGINRGSDEWRKVA
jgi:5-methylcytosine-specific restriction endonuclease McrA